MARQRDSHPDGAESSATTPATQRRAPSHLLVDVNPCYDFLFSFHDVAYPEVRGKWSAWVRETVDGLTVARQRAMQRNVLAWAYEALIPALPEPRTVEMLIAGIAAMPLADFLRVAVTTGLVAPDAQLERDDLEALVGDRNRTRMFIERYLRLTPLIRSAMVRTLDDPEAVRREMVETLAEFAGGPFAGLEPRLREERERAGERLREIAAGGENTWPDWLGPWESLQGFSPVVLAPAAFLDGGRAQYLHEISRSLFDGIPYEPLIIAAGPRLVLDGVTARKRGRATVGNTKSAAPEERFAAAFAALADPSRLRLVRLLAERPHYGQELAAVLHMSAATVSHHIAILARAELVGLERQSHRTYYVLRQERLKSLLHEGTRYALASADENMDAAGE